MNYSQRPLCLMKCSSLTINAYRSDTIHVASSQLLVWSVQWPVPQIIHCTPSKSPILPYTPLDGHYPRTTRLYPFSARHLFCWNPPPPSLSLYIYVHTHTRLSVTPRHRTVLKGLSMVSCREGITKSKHVFHISQYR